MKRLLPALFLVAAFVACGKEEWNRNQLGASSPWAETDETEPADDDPAEDAEAGTANAPGDAGADAQDARPADARSDARDATPG